MAFGASACGSASAPQTEGQTQRDAGASPPNLDSGSGFEKDSDVPDVIAKPDTGVPDAGPGESPILLFGGYDTNNKNLGDTWAFDGKTWKQVSSTGPSPRSEARMARLKGKVMLFGGCNDGACVDPSSQLGDTWTWDGTTWTKATDSGPSARWGSAITAVNGKVLMFGGCNGLNCGINLSDTWEWDGSSWKLVSTSGPPGRAQATMATYGGKVVMFGGFGGASPNYTNLADTWVWDGTSWAQATTPSGPTKRARPVLGEVTGKLTLFGGVDSFTGTRSAETWTWDGAAWTELIIAGSKPPAEASRQGALLDKKLFAYGGATAGPSITWQWNGAAWTELSIISPPMRRGSHMSQ